MQNSPYTDTVQIYVFKKCLNPKVAVNWLALLLLIWEIHIANIVQLSFVIKFGVFPYTSNTMYFFRREVKGSEAGREAEEFSGLQNGIYRPIKFEN